MVKLVDPTSNSTNEMDSDLMNEDWNVTDSTPVLDSEDQEVNPAPITPVAQVSNVQETPATSTLPPMPSMPQNQQPTTNTETPLLLIYLPSHFLHHLQQFFKMKILFLNQHQKCQ